MLIVRVTEKQERIVRESRARANGFMNKSEYVRFALFKKVPIEDKISDIHQRVVEL
jgi:Arc/MetJ-type ribon-helix-helix transcriptional regulator